MFWHDPVLLEQAPEGRSGRFDGDAHTAIIVKNRKVCTFAK
jgi:hypothetical protein